MKNILNKFLTAISRDFIIVAPIKLDKRLLVDKISNLSDIDWSGQIPQNTWKQFYLPANEVFLQFDGKIKKEISKVACVGVNILDLKALTLLNQVFSNDELYNQRKENALMIGFAGKWPSDFKKSKFFSHDFEENMLEHVNFDVFVAQQNNNGYIWYSGSSKGSKVLSKNGIDFKHIEFAGLIPESGLSKKVLDLKKNISTSAEDKLWKDLGEKCIACGKCSTNCPTCFCFDFNDSAGCRSRTWSSCFFNDFSKIAGGQKDLDAVKDKIYFWYVHKFWRIPEEYGVSGCVGCGRCSKSCPVAIDIFENLNIISKFKFNE